MEYFLERNVTVAVVIVAVLLVRLFIKKMPKKYSYLLWILVAIRMIFDITIPSDISIFNAVATVETQSEQMLSGYRLDRIEAAVEQLEQGNLPGTVEDSQSVEIGTVFTNEESSYTEQNNSQLTDKPINAVQSLQAGILGIWLAGMIVFLGYGIVSYDKCRRKVSQAVRYEGNVWECDRISSPFVLGIFKPQIYIPFHVEEKELEYILAHERYHIKRYDHIIKLVAFVLLAVYWMNPLAWVAFYLMSRDMEMSCDEAVLVAFGNEIKKVYSNSLLSFATKNEKYSFAPLSFGEADATKRIKNVLNFKKPKTWMVIIVALVLVVVGASCLTSQKEDAASENTNVEDTAGTEVAGTDKNSETKYFPMVDNSINTVYMVREWTKAFATRDGATIVQLATEETQKQLIEQGLLSVEEDFVSFGWSSPWPWDVEDEDFFLLSIDEEAHTAQISYRAQSSDPHVVMWVEELSYEWQGESFVVTEEKLTKYDNISTSEEFLSIYLSGIVGARWWDGEIGEALNENALLASNTEYLSLFEPGTAAARIFNLAEDDSKVRIHWYSDEADLERGEADVEIEFVGGDTIDVTMEQPYGKEGIWLPRSYKVDYMERFMAMDWSTIEQIPYDGYIDVDEYDEINCIAELPEHDIKVYGYADENNYVNAGVAIDIQGDVNYFDWAYTSTHLGLPKLYWDAKEDILQMTCHIYTGTGASADALHVMERYDSGHLEASDYEISDFMSDMEERVGFTYDKEAVELTIVDKQTGETLTSASMENTMLDMRAAEDSTVTGLNLGEISRFELGEQIYLLVEVGVLVDENVSGYYEDGICLKAEVNLIPKEYGGFEFEIGEIEAVTSFNE